MITSLSVTGFKSLNKLKVSFTKGLNVLIGPNGAGKTNICQVLSILSSLSKNNLEDALSYFGGSRAIFSTLDKNRKISIHVEGIAEGEYKKEHYSIEYIYKVNICIDANDTLTLEEKLTVSRIIDRNKRVEALNVSLNKHILKWVILDKDAIGDFKFSDSEGEIDLRENDSMWCFMPRISYSCYLIGRDLFMVKSININPNIARMPCDIVEPSTMLANGRYLSNALFEISKHPVVMSEINSILEQSLPCYRQIKPKVSDDDLKRYFVLEDENGLLFQSNVLSDGTIKLLGLLVGIVGQEKYTMIIEEPENYLHPQVHRLLIDYLRETFDEGVCVLTTHSETILNLIRPEELILCDINENVTKCRRIKNTEAISKAILASGFGCGYHYVAGNI